MRSPIISGLDFDDSKPTDVTGGGPTLPEAPRPPSRERRLSSAEIRESFAALRADVALLKESMFTKWEKRALLGFSGVIATTLSALVEKHTGIKIDFGGALLAWVGL